MKILKYSFLFLIVLLFSTCDTKNNASESIPSVYVNLQVNLLDPNQNIAANGGYRYIKNVGYKGILLYKDYSGNFIAFERCCPYKPSSVCEIVEMDASLLFLTCKCCGSTFDFKGVVGNGPASWPLTRYYTQLNGNILQISN